MANIDLEVESIESLGALMTSGEITARSLTQHCLDQIDKYDPTVNAILELNPDALDIADVLDAERANGKTRGPLHGMPILVKDNFDTGDKMMTTAGSLAMVGAPALNDAHVVHKLRQAGAVLLGKTNLSEWANFRSTGSSSGWSSRGGQTCNAYDHLRTPGGSSSGSAVAVAMGFCVAAIGTETDGSIVSPSAMNSVVGIKPTVGLVSRAGIIPISHSQDTAGPIARSVADAVAVLTAIAGPDGNDNATTVSSASQKNIEKLTLQTGALDGARIGIARNYCGYHPGVDGVFADAVNDLLACGAVIVDDLDLTPMTDIRPSETIVMATEFKAGLNKYLSKRQVASCVKSLADIIEFNSANADTVLPWFQQELLEMAQDTTGLDDSLYVEALAKCQTLSRKGGIDRLMSEHRLDAIVAPTTCTPWLIDWVNGDNRSGGSAGPAAVSSYPSVTVPMGYVQGLPVGISIFASQWCDALVLSYAHTYEQYSRRRRAPGFFRKPLASKSDPRHIC